MRVSRGSDKTFRITPDAGYEIADVLVDGESVGAVSRYTFETVRKNHTIEAEFRTVEKAPDTGVDRWLNTTDHMALPQWLRNRPLRPRRPHDPGPGGPDVLQPPAGSGGVTAARFTDVPADAWYARAVGDPGLPGHGGRRRRRKIRPERTITRAEFTVMAMRFARLPEGGRIPSPM